VLAGYATDLPFVPVRYCGRRWPRPWDDLCQAHELGSIEVAPQFRRAGVAGALVSAVVANGRLDGKIVIGEALSSHWDLPRSGLSLGSYRAMLLRIFERAGFQRFETSQPEVGFDPAGFLIARLGAQTSPASRSAFLATAAGNSTSGAGERGR
jgi:GNAT superfamily N-acetyltransferase